MSQDAALLVWFGAAVLLTAPFYLYIEGWKGLIGDRKTRNTPIVCICRTGHRTGVALRRDHNRGSRKEWRNYLNGRYPYDCVSERHTGRRITVEPVFVFQHNSRELATLLEGCFVEEAVFDVPSYRRPTDQSPSEVLAKAYKHFFGKRWDGTLIDL